MLVPELLWFAVMPGKDFLVAILGGIIFLYVYNIANGFAISKSLFFRILTYCSTGLIAIIRPTFLLVLAVGLAVTFFSTIKRTFPRLIPYMCVFTVVAITLVPLTSEIMESKVGNTQLSARAQKALSNDRVEQVLHKHGKGFRRRFWESANSE